MSDFSNDRNNAARKARSSANDAADAAETTMNKAKAQMGRLSQDAAGGAREGMDAFMQSTSIFAKGMENLFRTSMSLAQSAAEKQGQLLKQAMSSKTLNEWSEAQNKIAQSSFDDFMAGATQLSEIGVRLLSDASAPLNSQMTKSMKKTTDSMAA